jgi:hypothetical protein
MELGFFDRFADPFLKTANGKGVFLSGIVLGLVAAQQVERGSLSDAPLFKQITFGRMQTRDIRRLLARVPELSKAYRLKNAGRVSQLLGMAGNCFLEGKGEEMGVNGNFTFAVAFTNAWRYYKEIFPKDTTETPAIAELESEESGAADNQLLLIEGENKNGL